MSPLNFNDYLAQKKMASKTISQHQANLENLYERYEIRDERTHRNKVILGLLVYQGLTREELETLRPEHLKLREGKIQVLATGKLNGRILRLEPHQVIDLQEYVLLVRQNCNAKRKGCLPAEMT
ncbi:site-specific integrase [Hufsiella ginkgonis]|uniref:Tyrosine-type recombinase/integrase n=1 Tax=Hufsiella ginkgonis TaxID=2695274 RepID=A0A7K1XXR3_9SPHI|nr:site-specific integrase [Hufsiella ginkgonis]MXV15618.1 hypothetical protein [Hufsiella ginkgonis]